MSRSEFNVLTTSSLIDFDSRAMDEIAYISYVSSGSGRMHPVYKFVDSHGQYVCEVRYGGATANALQRGLWTHTKNALPYFESLTNGWIDYSHNLTLVKLFGLALVASESGHKAANLLLQNDIDQLKQQ